MPLYDYQCNSCKSKEERLVFSCYDSQICSECGAMLQRQFSPQGQKFKLVYNNKTDMCDWSGNTSRYWDDVNKQKEGKVTVPVEENIS